MKTVSAARIAAKFDDYLTASRERPVVVTRNGKPVAVLMGVQSLAEAEQLAAGPSRSLRSILQESDVQLKKGEGIPHDQFWRELKQSRPVKQKASARRKLEPALRPGRS